MYAGTPLQNNLDELYSVVHFASPGFLGSLQDFKVKGIYARVDKYEQKSPALFSLATCLPACLLLMLLPTHLFSNPYITESSLLYVLLLFNALCQLPMQKAYADQIVAGKAAGATDKQREKVSYELVLLWYTWYTSSLRASTRLITLCSSAYSQHRIVCNLTGRSSRRVLANKVSDYRPAQDS